MVSRALASWSTARQVVRRRRRAVTANVVSLAGLSTICVGVAMWSVPLALIAAGVAGVIVAQGIEADE